MASDCEHASQEAQVDNGLRLDDEERADLVRRVVIGIVQRCHDSVAPGVHGRRLTSIVCDRYTLKPQWLVRDGRSLL